MTQKWKQYVGLGSLLLGLVTSGSAMGQGPAIAYPINNWSYLRHSSTANEGAFRGQAALIGAAGQAVYMDSLAAINYEEAYSRAIENSVAVTKAYYERRELHDEYMRKYGPKPLIGEARKKAIEYYQPKKLSASEFNAQTGTLTWPHILRQEQFAPIKNQIDEVFSQRTFENSGDGSVTHRQIYSLCNALSGMLRENISRVTTDQYIDAKEFIRSVELEGRSTVPQELAVLPVKEAEVAAPKAEEPKDQKEVAAPAKGDVDTSLTGRAKRTIKT
jgi:hypothetical protein